MRFLVLLLGVSFSICCNLSFGQSTRPYWTSPTRIVEKIFLTDLRSNDIKHPRVVTRISILFWNVESGGNKPDIVATKIAKLINSRKYDIVVLSEVENTEIYPEKIREKSWWKYCSCDFYVGKTGKRADQADDHLMFIWRSDRLQKISSKEHSWPKTSSGYCASLVLKFRESKTKDEITLINNHFAGSDANIGQRQAARLRDFARGKSDGIVCIGNFNFEYRFDQKRGKKTMDKFMKDGIWNWVKPEKWVDTNWADRNKDGKDDSPGSLVDFAFVAGAAKDWLTTCRVLTWDGDFPDDETTSDHRPIELVLMLPLKKDSRKRAVDLHTPFVLKIKPSGQSKRWMLGLTKAEKEGLALAEEIKSGKRKLADIDEKELRKLLRFPGATSWPKQDH